MVIDNLLVRLMFDLNKENSISKLVNLQSLVRKIWPCQVCDFLYVLRTEKIPFLMQNWRENGNFFRFRIIYKIRILGEAIFSVFYNIQPNFAILLISRYSFELW